MHTEHDGSMTVCWMGAAGCRISDGRTAFYIDPFVSRPGLFRVAFRRALVPARTRIADWNQRLQQQDGVCASSVIVGHSHYDHAMDAPFFALACGADLVGSESTAWVGRGAGVPEERIRTVSDGDVLTIGRFRVHFLETCHGPALFGRVPFPGRIRTPLVPPAPAFNYRLGKMFALVIEHPSGTLVHNGSAGYRPGMFRQIHADAILQCIAGRKGSRGLFEHIVLPLGVQIVIPIHYDHFFSYAEGPFKPLPGIRLEEFIRTAGAYEQYCRIEWIPMGDTVDVFSPPNHK